MESNVLDHFEKEETRQLKEPLDKAISWVIRLTLTLILITANLKILGADSPIFIFWILFLVLNVFYGLRFYRKQEKGLIDWFKLLAILILSLSVWIDYRVDIRTDFSINISSLISMAMFFILLLIHGAKYFKNENKTPRLHRFWEISKWSILIGIFVYYTGVLFKIMHWPFSTILILTSTLFWVLGILMHIREHSN